ncbi:hypothetical protein THAOC_30012, partial [Thalassiosira oceanica]
MQPDVRELWIVAEAVSEASRDLYRALLTSCPLSCSFGGMVPATFATAFVLYPATMIRDMIDQQVLELKKLWANKRQLTFQLLNLAMIVFSALMIW